MKGIILAGGHGTRLYPLTIATSKQLLPVFDKPMIYYPLSTLMLAGIRDILIISTPHDLPMFQQRARRRRRLRHQPHLRRAAAPRRPRASLHHRRATTSAKTASRSPSATTCSSAKACRSCCKTRRALTEGRPRLRLSRPRSRTLRRRRVRRDGRALSIVEKPKEPKSNWAVIGLYFYDNRVVDIARNLKPSAARRTRNHRRQRALPAAGELQVERLSRGYAWLDCGTHDSLIEVGEFVRTIQHRTGLQIACLEEIALDKGWIEPRPTVDAPRRKSSNPPTTAAISRSSWRSAKRDARRRPSRSPT